MTQMVTLDVFMPRITPKVAGAAYPIIEDAIRLAAEEFCERAKTWRTDDVITLSGVLTEYPATPEGAVIHEIESARSDNGAIDPITLSDLSERDEDWRTRTGVAPTHMTQEEYDSIIFYPTAASGSVTVQLILKPSPNATQLPAFLYNQHSRIIADGAIATLMEMPKEEFSNPELSVYHRNKFQAAIDRMAFSTAKGQQRAKPRTRASFF